MSNRIICLVLTLLLVLVQMQMWSGRGSIPDSTLLQHKLDMLQAANTNARQANAQLAAEVTDLNTGLEAVEEKARMELGMVKPGEIYVQIAQ